MRLLKQRYSLFLAVVSCAALVFALSATANAQQQKSYPGLTVQSETGNSGYQYQQPSQQKSGGYSGLVAPRESDQYSTNPYQGQRTTGRATANANKRRAIQQQKQRLEAGQQLPRKTMEQKFSASPEKLSRIKALRAARSKNLKAKQAEVAKLRANAQRPQRGSSIVVR